MPSETQTWGWLQGMSLLNNYFCTLKRTFKNNCNRIGWITNAICNFTGVISSILRGSVKNFQLKLGFIVMWNSYSRVIYLHTCISCYDSPIYFPQYFRHWWWSIIPAGQLDIVPYDYKLCLISINCHYWCSCNWNTTGVKIKYFRTPGDFSSFHEQEIGKLKLSF